MLLSYPLPRWEIGGTACPGSPAGERQSWDLVVSQDNTQGIWDWTQGLWDAQIHVLPSISHRLHHSILPSLVWSLHPEIWDLPFRELQNKTCFDGTYFCHFLHSLHLSDCVFMTLLLSELSLEEANMDIVKGTQEMRKSGNNCQHSHLISSSE